MNSSFNNDAEMKRLAAQQDLLENVILIES